MEYTLLRLLNRQCTMSMWWCSSVQGYRPRPMVACLFCRAPTGDFRQEEDEHTEDRFAEIHLHMLC